jgi:hypothetical protein
MIALTRCLTAVALLLFASSCVIPKSYPDTKIRASAPRSVVLNQPTTMAVNVVGKVNGKERALAAKAFKKAIITALGKVDKLTVGEGGGRLDIVAENIGDVQDAVRKGAASGLTMGIMGVEVTDHYAFNFTYTGAGGKSYSNTYRHAIHSILGATKSPPEGVTTTSLPKALQMVVDDLVFSFLRDLTKNGKL